MAELIRLQKLLAGWGIASRRAIERMIVTGKIAINGKIVKEQGLKLDPDDLPKIAVDGKSIKPPKSQTKHIYLFHKPVGVITTLDDPEGRETIKKYLPKGKRLYPIGRLDYNSSGLLLITDDGDLTNRLLHPSYKVEKEYVVEITGSSLTRFERNEFQKGVELDDGKTLPCRLSQHRRALIYSIIIKEGRKRQVRRMFKAYDKEVVKLHRIRIGPINLTDLRAGEIRPITSKEKSALLSAVKLTQK